MKCMFLICHYPHCPVCTSMGLPGKISQKLAFIYGYVNVAMWYVMCIPGMWITLDIEAFTLINISKINLNLKVVPGMILINKFIG